MTRKPSTQSPALNQQSEIEMLRARLAELEKNDEEKQEVKIQQDEYIPVMSLLPYNLNLSTKEAGMGSIKKFTKFGEVKRILYKDLLDILEVHHSFMEAGYFYILHPAFIRQQGLDDTYATILTKDKIEKIISTNSDDSVELYKSANERQQEIIVQLLIDKVRADPNSVNLNIIDRISRLSKRDIVKIAEEAKELESPSEE